MPSVRNKELVVHLRKNKGENIGIRVQQSKTAPANYEIKKINENGAAARDSSLREGDSITAVNGKSIKGMNKDAVMLLKQCAEMTRVTFDVIRKDTVTDPPATNTPRRQNSARKHSPSPLPQTRNGAISDNVDYPHKPALKSPMVMEGGSGRPKKTRNVSIVMPGQRRSREQLYDPDDIILLDPSKATSSDGPNLHKPMPLLQERPSPIELPPEYKKEYLLKKSKSLIPSDKNLLPILPHTLSPSDRTKSMGDIQLPSMQKRTKPITLHNYRTNKLLEDHLINSDIQKNESGCNEEHCVGSHVSPVKERGSEVAHVGQDLQACAEDFLEQYYSFTNRAHSEEHSARLDEVLNSIEETGSYELTLQELEFGAKTAWRNAPRCINRIIWNTLHVFDRRKVTTAQEMFQSLLEHIKFATNNGNLRSAITIFRQRTKPGRDFRIWNNQLIRYAGYEREKPDGTREIIGDPISVDITKICMRLGWRPPDNKFGKFDILPLVLQPNGKDPEFFIIPEDLVMEVHLTHPDYDWFEDFDLKWYALPAMGDMLLEIGGLEFTASPFSGWFMSTEIASRNLCDTYRYNMLKPVAQKMGLDTKQDRSLWKDKAMVEVNVAVLSSFQKAQVAIVDHHSASETFIKHMDNEYRVRGGCPADWVWIVPPISGSCVETFHQEMLYYHLSPSYEYQVPAWKNYKFKDNIAKTSAKGGAIKLKSVVNMIMLTKHLFTDIALKNRFKTLVLYATETGRSRNYAGIVNEFFLHAFDSREMCMDEYNIANLLQEHLVLVVTSTFGSGDPPSNGESFGQALYDLRHPTSLIPRTSHRLSTVLSPRVETPSQLVDSTLLSNVKFSVFGLGSRAFPNFCTFAHSVDKLFEELGGHRFHPCGEGDELCGQEESFRSWCKSAYQEACKEFGVDPNLKVEDTDKMLASGKAHSYKKGRFRAKPWDKSPVEHNICIALSKVHKKPAHSAVLKSRRNLQSKDSNRSTILCVLESDQLYSPGDHLAIYPENNAALVNTILKRLKSNPSSDQPNLSLDENPGPDEPLIIEYRTEADGKEEWEQETRLPAPLTLRQALTHYLDITSPPTPQFLSLLAKQTNRQTDRETLTKLAKGGVEYEDWKYSCFPNLLDVIELFPSLQKMDICLLLTGLPLLQTRYYSISSSPLKHKNEIHITVAVVSFMKKVLTSDRRESMHHGVCSTWLNNIPIGTVVPCSIRVARNFHMPEDPKTPMVLIGPGTGIAPFRSFWQEREYQIENLKVASTPSQLMDPEEAFRMANRKEKLTPTPIEEESTDGMPFQRSVSDARDLRALARKAAAKKKDFGKMIIYFGCRNSHMDHIYKEEMEKCKMSGALDEVYVGYSRDKDVMEKTYVQDLLKKNANEIIELLMESQAQFYVCGDISMAADVYRTLENIMADHAAMSSNEAREFMDKIKESGRYHEDIFGVTLRTAEVTQQKRTAAKRAWTILFSAMDESMQEVPKTPQDQTDGIASPVAKVQQNMGGRRISLVRRPTVTVLINQQAGTPHYTRNAQNTSELAQLTDASEAIRTVPDAGAESPTGDPTTAYTQHPPRYSATATTQQFGRKRQQDVETLT